MKKTVFFFALLFIFQIGNTQNGIPEIQKFEPIDVFDLEFVSDPQISPDGQHIIYVRNFKDIMTDKNLSNLWSIGSKQINLLSSKILFSAKKAFNRKR